ncbi:MAG: hypothetical protein IJS62_09290 [Bacteroidales bacterium]|nr:hypothetical protein [Bacteroidales bacterium]
MKFRFVPLVLAVALSVQSCLTEDMRAPQFVFEVEDVTVPADEVAPFGKGSLSVKTGVPVRCTENWSAFVVNPDEAPWLKIAAQDGNNPAGADVTGTLRLECAVNEAYAARQATLRLLSRSGQLREINVTQLAKTDRIALDGESAYSLPAESEAEIQVKILSNTDWSVEVTPEGAATVTPMAGSGDAVAVIKPQPNYSCTEGTVTTVTFRVNGGEAAAKVAVKRTADQPFIAANAVDIKQFRLPNATSGTLRFNCNAPWKAEVLSSTLLDFALSASEGEGGMKTELPYTMAPNESGESLQAKVKFSLASDPAKSVTLTITHWTGFTVAVDFTPAIEESIPFPLQPADESVPAIPWVSSNSGGLNTQGETFFYKFTAPDGKEYLFGLKNGLISRYFASGMGFLRMNAGSIRLPAVEGYRLGYVEFTTAATNKTFSIARNPEGTDLIGAKKTTNTGDVAAWEFENTEYNTSYYEIVGSGSSRQRNLILLYVK